MRTYVHSTTSARLTQPARSKLETLMKQLVYKRSKLVEANTAKTWDLRGSENIDAILKSSYLIATNALRGVLPTYGDSYLLNDGSNLLTHQSAWREYWKKYFRERAREGVGTEYAAPGYAKYSLSSYYNVRDLAGSAIVRTQGEKFLNLYWADFAQDFLPSTGARGGAKARSGKDIFNPQNDVRPWTYLNTWHEQKDWTEAVQYPVLVAATSSYRVHAVVTDMAKDANKPAFTYTSRRPGLLVGLTNDSSGDVYKVGFEGVGNDSQQRRVTFNTPDYVFGALKSVPRSLGSAGYQNSGNRWMGVTFASTADAVLAIFGNGTGGGAGRGYAEIVGEAKRNAMVIAKDPSATANIGTRIFISHSVAVINEGGWHFARAGNGYAAFRIANKSISGITTSPVDSTPIAGVMLELEDQWSPVAFQMGRASDYSPSICNDPNTPAATCAAARYAAFRAAVIANPARFSYDSASKKLTYVSLANETYVIYSGQNYTANLAAYPLPSVNGDASVNPTKTYDSPYISGTHGQDTVTLTYGNHPPLVLDFIY